MQPSNTCVVSNHIPDESVKPFNCALSDKYIPHDIVLSIVSKLPPRSIKRFNCVSKSWALLLQDSHFINMFQNNLLTSNSHSHFDDKDDNDPCFLLMYVEQGIDVLYLASGKSNVRLDWPPYADDNMIIPFILDYVVNGTLCLAYHENAALRASCHDKIVLWNPVTKEFKIIPHGPKPRREHFCRLQAFGYDHVSDDYKIILHDIHSCKWEIYSLRSNSWRTLDGYIPFDPYFSSIIKLYSNGIYYWLSNSVKGYEKCVVSFDFNKEELLVTPLPVGHGWLKRNIVLLDGSLALISNSQHSPDTFHISISDQLGVGKSWIKLFTVGTIPDLQRVVGTRREGRDILFEKNNGKLALLDLTTLMIKPIDVQGLSRSPELYMIIFYKKSLLLIKRTNGD